MRIQYVGEAHSSEDSEVVSVFILGQQSAKVLGTLYIMRESQARYIFTSGNEGVNIMEIHVDTGHYYNYEGSMKEGTQTKRTDQICIYTHGSTCV